MVTDFHLQTAPNLGPSIRASRGIRLLLIFIFLAGSVAVAKIFPIKNSNAHRHGYATIAGSALPQDTREANMSDSTSPVITDEIKIVDGRGRSRITMSAKSGNPVIQLLQTNGAQGIEILLDPAGRPAVKMVNPDPKGPKAMLEVDDKGAHVIFDRPGGASSYLFLNNAGASGVVLVDSNGVRRLDVLVGPDNSPKMEQFGAGGKPITQLRS